MRPLGGLWVAMAVALAGCTSSVPVSCPVACPAACPLASQRPMTAATLFFGRDIPGRATLTDAEWADFAAAEVTPRFPGGFTASDGEGQWRNPGSGRITHEPVKILVIAAEPAPDMNLRLAAVIDSYKARYHQQSVGVLTTPSCGAF